MITLDGVRIPVFERGEGEPLVLFHGYMGSHLTWRHEIAEYARHFRVIAFDWIGWGAAGRDATLDLSYAAELDRFRRFLDALGLGRVHLIGHDYGGFVGLGFAQAYPERVRKLVLVNSRAHRSWRPQWYAILGAMTWLARAPKSRALFRLLPLARLHRYFVRKDVQRGTFTRELFDLNCGWSGIDEAAEFLAEFYRTYRVGSRPDLDAGLGKMQMPVLIVWGGRNPFLSDAIAKDLARKIPNAELRIYPDAHHFVPEEVPELFLRDTLAFLRA